MLGEVSGGFERGENAVKLAQCVVNFFQNFLFPKVDQLSLYYIV